MNERERLERELQWLKVTVLPGFQQRDWPAAANRITMHIDDLEWRLETEPIRPKPQCGWPGVRKDKTFRQHGENCPRHNPHCQAVFDLWRKAYAAAKG